MAEAARGQTSDSEIGREDYQWSRLKCFSLLIP